MAFLKKIATDKSDAELVAAFRQTHDMELVGELFQRYIDLVYGVCLKYLKQPEDAQDSTMSVFEELSSKLAKHDVDYFKGWLYTLTKNFCLMRLRSGKKQHIVNLDPMLMQSDEIVHLNGVLEKEENLKQLEFCLEQLADDQRSSIKLFYLEGKCYKEITELTGLEWSKVRSYIQNGRRNLKICMETQAKSIV